MVKWPNSRTTLTEVDPVASSTVAILLAAGEGTRMVSKSPKVLHEVAGLPMLEYALRNAERLSPSRVLAVLGAGSSQVRSYLGKRAVSVLQSKRRGTGHAAQQALPYLRGFKGDVLVVHADACLVRPQTVLALRQFHRLQGSEVTLLTARVDSPFGYGRILRGGQGEVMGIVEEKDATDPQRRLNEINAGVYFFKGPALAKALSALKPREGGELYLTDTVHGVLSQGGKAQALMVPDRTEVFGINDRAQLAQAHRLLNLRRVEDHQREGVTFLDPFSVELGPDVVIGRDCVIEGGVKLLGGTRLGEDCRVGSGSLLSGAKLGRSVIVKASRVVDSELKDGCDAGPFAHIRGGSVLEAGVHVGTNAELKAVRVGSGSKVGHFSYVGDAVLGKQVNVGAGCVFANFDGKRKHACRVGDGAFLGSNSTLVAPLSVGAQAVVGAGAVVTQDVSAKVTVVGVPAKPVGRK
jgi:bifunctional UDP-N-acetylglucosamine pyrophosphorylase / glucosamine-1-phosphate N-acetyltransferase